MEELINFIIDLANDELYDFLDGNSRLYFLQGGCYEFAKILKELVNNSQIMIDEANGHCGVLYFGNIYDASGKVNGKYKFVRAKEEDINYMEDRFGIPEKIYIKGKRISEYIIDEMKECNIDYIMKRFDEER